MKGDAPMPIHNWKRASVGLYHHFHQTWAVTLAEGLNAGVLPNGYFALIDQRTIELAPDVLALKLEPTPSRSKDRSGGVLLAKSPPQVRYIAKESDAAVYAKRANRLAIRNVEGEVVAIIEIVSPGNKHSKDSIRKFIDKAVEMLDRGVNLLIIDLFPPTKRDPQGIHKAIWDEISDDSYALPKDKPLTCVAYNTWPGRTAYVENMAVGDSLPSMPIFLDPSTYVRAPLEETYQSTWQRCPKELRNMVLKAARAS
jgi:Protein of unknown function (DUF4058)